MYNLNEKPPYEVTLVRNELGTFKTIEEEWRRSDVVDGKLHGNYSRWYTSEIGAHVRRNLEISKKKKKKKSPGRPIFLLVCATFSELPSDIITMVRSRLI